MFHDLFGARAAHTAKVGRSRSGRRDLHLETLEDRALLSAVPCLSSLIPAANTAPAIHAAPAPSAIHTTPTATQLKIAVPTTVIVGKPVWVTVFAQDSSGRPASDTSTLTVSSSAADAVLPSNNGSITFRNGVATFTVTFPTAAAGDTISVKDRAGTPLTATSASINVVDPTLVTKFSVQMPRNVQVNTPVTVRIVAQNALGWPVSSYSGTSLASLGSSDTAAVLPTSDEINFINGVATVSVTFKTPGSGTTLTAQDLNTSATGSATLTVVDPTVATEFQVLTPHKVATGTSFNVTVIALNSLHQPVSGYVGPVTITSSDTATGVILPDPSTLTWTNGETTFAVTLVTPSTSSAPTTLTVADNSATPNTALTKTVNIVAVDPTVLAGFRVTLPARVQPNTAVTVNVQAFNGLGQALTSYTGPDTVTSSDTSVSVNAASLTFTNGATSFPVTFTSTGPVTLTVADTNSSTLTTVNTFVGSIGRGGRGFGFGGWF
jgi:hypothetical protein